MTKFKPEITLFAQMDDIPVRGNAIVSGDDDYDREVEGKILSRLEYGDVWAWAQVEVRASINRVFASAYLGGCSYEDEQDFIGDTYYADMVIEATERLRDTIREIQAIEL